VKIKYLADENLRQGIVLGVQRREPGVSFFRAPDLGMTGKDDLTVLRLAAQEQRILVSHDLKTLPRHFGQFVARQSSPGVFLIPQNLSLNRAIEELILLWAASEASEWENLLVFLPL
jgi:hypothetical protein